MQPKERLNTPACLLLSSLCSGRGIAGLSVRAAIVLTFAMFLTLPLFVRKKADMLVMENGDRIPGGIKGLDAGVLRVDLDYIDGTISLRTKDASKQIERGALSNEHDERSLWKSL
jgi:hypothetical protein